MDDDTVVQALEDLKGEAGDVAKEVRCIAVQCIAVCGPSSMGIVLALLMH